MPLTDDANINSLLANCMSNVGADKGICVSHLDFIPGMYCVWVC